MFKPTSHLNTILSACAALGGEAETAQTGESWKTRVSWGTTPTEKTVVRFTSPTTVGDIARELGLVQPWGYMDREEVRSVTVYLNTFTAQNGDGGEGIVLATLSGKRTLPHLGTGGQVMVMRDGVMYQDHAAPKTALSFGLHG